MTEREFKRRRGGLVNLLYLEIDDQHAREMRSALAKGRFDVAEQTISRQTDCNERFYYVEAAADWKDDAPFLREWAAGGSLVGRLAAAIHALKHSWNHTTWTHGPNDMPRFQIEADAANKELGAVAKASPRDATPIYWLIWAAFATGQHERAKQLYEEGVRRAPTLLATRSVGLRVAAPLPFGSQQAALDLARQIVQDMPRGLGADMLIPEAHWMVSGMKAGEYWQSPEVRDEVLDADERDRQSPPSGTNLLRSHQWFTYGLWAIGQPGKARDRFEAIRGLENQWPWSRYRFGFNTLFGEFRKASKASRRR
jgi:hypothetical protein